MVNSIVSYTLPPLIRNPPNKNPPLGGETCCDYQFTRRHHYPPHKKPPSEANMVTIDLDGGTINSDGGGDSY